jgi:hypothetical protein
MQYNTTKRLLIIEISPISLDNESSISSKSFCDRLQASRLFSWRSFQDTLERRRRRGELLLYKYKNIFNS